MGKPTVCMGVNKGANQLTAKLISAFVFAAGIVQSFLTFSMLSNIVKSISQPTDVFSNFFRVFS